MKQSYFSMIKFSVYQPRRGGRNLFQIGIKKKIADDPGCLRSGKISGKFRALNSILEEESIKEIKEILRLRGGHIGRKDTAMSQKKRRRVS